VLEGCSRAQAVEDAKKVEARLGVPINLIKTSELFLHERSLLPILQMLLTSDKPIVMAQSFYWHHTVLETEKERKVYLGFIKAFELLLMSRPSLVCFTNESYEKGYSKVCNVPFMLYDPADMQTVFLEAKLTMNEAKAFPLDKLTTYEQQKQPSTVWWLSEPTRRDKGVFFQWDENTLSGRRTFARLGFLLANVPVPPVRILAGRVFTSNGKDETARVNEAIRQTGVDKLVVFGADLKRRAENLFPTIKTLVLPYTLQALEADQLYETAQLLQDFYKHASRYRRK